MVFILWEIKVMQPDLPSYTFFAMMQETFGTFCFVLFFMIATDEKSHFSSQNAINCFTIACGYVAAREIVSGSTTSFASYGVVSTYGACMNPAVAVGITLTSVMKDPGNTFKWGWIYWLMPLAGALIALIFYRLIYVKTQVLVSNHNSEEQEHENEF